LRRSPRRAAPLPEKHKGLRPKKEMGARAPAHRFVNRSAGDVLLLVVGDRTPDDEITYPDVDMHARLGRDGQYHFTTKSGDPL
jgi:uncharacterized cupin superfamily protein